MKYNHLEIIGIHIMKTAGRSFKAVLQKQYPKRYYRINIRPREINRAASFKQKIAKMPDNTSVIHGHFHYSDIVDLLADNPEVPLVTWLRDPVQRVISQYYFTKKRYENDQIKRAGKIADMSLVDFARKKSLAEPMTHVLAGVNLKDLYFVGVFEYLDEDLDCLANLLGWRNYQMPKINVNTSFKARYLDPTDQELAQIQDFFQADIDLYNYALKLRKIRLRDKDINGLQAGSA